MSHRALMLGALATGKTVVHDLLEGDDVIATAEALRCMGVDIARDEGDAVWVIHGCGVGGLQEPAGILDMGNSGTAARLLSGILTSHPFVSFMSGDSSLNARPMGRVIDPLSRMGGRFVSRQDGKMPLAIIGNDRLMPIEYAMPVASAQVKSAILLAALNTRGRTRVIEPSASRDHTENMLRYFGAEVVGEKRADGACIISVDGPCSLSARDVRIPADPSSAAFPMVGALVREGSDIILGNVGINPLRIGLFTTLQEMGATIDYTNVRDDMGEKTADIRVRASALRGVEVPAERVPSMIDEYPILAIAAACADGETSMRGLGELRVKESDRLDAMARGLEAAGVAIEEGPDWLCVKGTGRAPRGGMTAVTRLDHRIAMAFLILGTVSEQPVCVDDVQPVETSFPGFVSLMNGMGASITADTSAESA